MQSLFRSLREAPEGGGQLPMPFPALAEQGAYFRRGQASIIAAGPGGGKTAFVTNYIVHPEVARQVAILYFSPDSDPLTVGPRLLGTIQQMEVRDVFRDFAENGAGYLRHMEAAKRLKHIQWCFDSSPNYTDIQEEVDAYAAVHGRYPDLIVLDNIRDVYEEITGEGGEYQRHSGTVDYFKDMAYQTKAAVILLHHLTGEYEDSTKWAPLSALQGKIGKNARMVFTLFSPDDYTLGSAVVKNSNGPRHQPGEYVPLDWNKGHQIISGKEW